MAITLVEQEVIAKTILVGSDEFSVAAGKSLTIETAPSGEEILNEEVPAGKSWQVTVSVQIVETDT